MFKKLLTIFTATFMLSLTLVSYDPNVNVEGNIAITNIYEEDGNN